MVWADDGHGMKVFYALPIVTIADYSLTFGPRSNDLYTLRWYNLDLGPPGYDIDPDTLGLDDWCTRRLEDAIRGYHDQERAGRDKLIRDTSWYEIIRWDASGHPKWIHPLALAGLGLISVSSDERHIAYTDDKRIWVYDLDSESIIPIAAPPLSSLSSPSYSPDGHYLALVERDSLGDDTIRLLDAQSLVPIRELRLRRGTAVWGILWLPDSEWVLAHVRLPGDGLVPRDVVAIEVSTGGIVPVRRPYSASKSAAIGVYVAGLPTWTRSELPDSTQRNQNRLH
jgi:hypothetical protein